jgi:autoinducer 2-degrading protein
MLAKWVKVRVKPSERQRFLEAIEIDALGSEANEPGCLRFNVLQDAADADVYYFYEVYEDEGAVEQHEKTGHFAAWLAVRGDALVEPPRIDTCRIVFPSDPAYWQKGRR